MSDRSFRARTEDHPLVVGIYGVPGSGKTHLLTVLKETLRDEDFQFFEGSERIGSLVGDPDGLEAFRKMDETSQSQFRERAIDDIQAEVDCTGKVAVVTGHLMFWTQDHGSAKQVYTNRDLEVYTHILYLDTPDDIVAQRWKDDKCRDRGKISREHISKWQEAEKDCLRRLCHDHGILFSIMSGLDAHFRVEALLRDFLRHEMHYNLSEAEKTLDDFMSAGDRAYETVLVIDADKTLSASDASELFWREIGDSAPQCLGSSPLTKLFSSQWGYSYQAFRQATLLYETASDDAQFDMLCQQVAHEVSLYPDMLELLHAVSFQEHIAVVILTSGLRKVWHNVLVRLGVSAKIKVLGGGRIADRVVVTAEVKRALVCRLRDVHKTYVCAFGDGPLDIGMLKEAHRAIVIVGEEKMRSKSMERSLASAIADDGFVAEQILLPSNVSARLDTQRLPVVSLSEPTFTSSILRRRQGHARLEITLASDKPAALLLATDMRDAAVSGPALRKVHQRAGAYLALEYLGSALGLEHRPISHVLGHQSQGSQLSSERRTTIVAMMRGGEAMAYGVNEVFPRAMFLHAKVPADITLAYLQGQKNVILVDSVINTGRSITDFVRQVRRLHPTIRIAVIAGVVQSQAIEKANPSSLNHALSGITGVTLIGLRTSKTKFTGSGATDTGNRLFNTAHLD